MGQTQSNKEQQFMSRFIVVKDYKEMAKMIVQDKFGQIALIHQMKMPEGSSNNFQQNLHKRMQMQNSHLLKLKECHIVKKLLNKPDKLFLLYEYSLHNLAMEILSRQQKKLFFQQKQIWSIICSVTIAMSYLEQQNIPHGILSVENIFITDNGTIKIADPDTSLRVNKGRQKYIYYSPEEMDFYRTSKSPKITNRFKSDLFTLGICILHSIMLQNCFHWYDYDKMILRYDKIMHKINLLQATHGKKLIKAIRIMTNKDNRPTFRQFQMYLQNVLQQQIESIASYLSQKDSLHQLSQKLTNRYHINNRTIKQRSQFSKSKQQLFPVDTRFSYKQKSLGKSRGQETILTNQPLNQFNQNSVSQKNFPLKHSQSDLIFHNQKKISSYKKNSNENAHSSRQFNKISNNKHNKQLPKKFFHDQSLPKVSITKIYQSPKLLIPISMKLQSSPVQANNNSLQKEIRKQQQTPISILNKSQKQKNSLLNRQIVNFEINPNKLESSKKQTSYFDYQQKQMQNQSNMLNNNKKVVLATNQLNDTLSRPISCHNQGRLIQSNKKQNILVHNNMANSHHSSTFSNKHINIKNIFKFPQQSSHLHNNFNHINSHLNCLNNQLPSKEQNKTIYRNYSFQEINLSDHNNVNKGQKQIFPNQGNHFNEQTTNNIVHIQYKTPTIGYLHNNNQQVVHIPNNTSSIGYLHNNNQQVHIPNNTSSIGYLHNNNQQVVHIPNNTSSIGYLHNNNQQVVHIPNNTPSIGYLQNNNQQIVNISNKIPSRYLQNNNQQFEHIPNKIPSISKKQNNNQQVIPIIPNKTHSIGYLQNNTQQVRNIHLNNYQIGYLQNNTKQTGFIDNKTYQKGYEKLFLQQTRRQQIGHLYNKNNQNGQNHNKKLVQNQNKSQQTALVQNYDDQNQLKKNHIQSVRHNINHTHQKQFIGFRNCNEQETRLRQMNLQNIRVREDLSYNNNEQIIYQHSQNLQNIHNHQVPTMNLNTHTTRQYQIVNQFNQMKERENSIVQLNRKEQISPNKKNFRFKKLDRTKNDKSVQNVNNSISLRDMDVLLSKSIIEKGQKKLLKQDKNISTENQLQNSINKSKVQFKYFVNQNNKEFDSSKQVSYQKYLKGLQQPKKVKNPIIYDIFRTGQKQIQKQDKIYLLMSPQIYKQYTENLKQQSKANSTKLSKQLNDRSILKGLYQLKQSKLSNRINDSRRSDSQLISKGLILENSLKISSSQIQKQPLISQQRKQQLKNQKLINQLKQYLKTNQQQKYKIPKWKGIAAKQLQKDFINQYSQIHSYTTQSMAIVDQNHQKFQNHQSISVNFFVSQSDTKQTYVVQSYQNGGRYQGWKLKNQKQGHGKFYYQDGGKYSGMWKQNMMHGHGILYYPCGKKAYDGQWKNDKFHGLGALFNQNPQKLNHSFDFRNFDEIGDYWLRYEGNFFQDNKEGPGKLYLTNGQIFQGFFVNDDIKGNGIFYSKKGIIKGFWEYNRFIND